MYSFLQNYMIYSPLNVLPLYFTLSLLESSLWLSSESFMLSSFICAVLIWSEHYSECLTRGNHYLKVLMGLNLRHVVEVNDALILTTALICWLRTSFLTTRTPSFRREKLYKLSSLHYKQFFWYTFWNWHWFSYTHLKIDTNKQHPVYFLTELYFA